MVAVRIMKWFLPYNKGLEAFKQSTDLIRSTPDMKAVELSGTGSGTHGVY